MSRPLGTADVLCKDGLRFSVHPDGARDSIDPRLPARWHAGDKPIPPWVGPALVTLLESHSEQARALARRLNGK